MFRSFCICSVYMVFAIGWECALWLQRLCSVAVLDCFNYNYVASKGDVKAFFGLRLRFGRFSARVQMVFGSFCICSVLHRLGMCSVVPKIVLCGFQR